MMRRDLWRILAALLFLGILPVAAEDFIPLDAPEINAESVLIIDARTGHELFAKNASEKRPVASTQKLLTALLVVEDGDLDQPVVVQQADTEVEPTVLGLKAGEVYPRRELVRALLVKSGNDIAMTLGRSIGGDIPTFARAMNRKARSLYAWSSNFVNPSGLPAENQYSTARDMARIARAAYFHPVLRGFVDTERFLFQRQDGVDLALVNTNQLLGDYPPCNGMKTGYTRASGACLISSASNEHREVICVVLGSNKQEIWKESRSLLDWALALP